MSTQSKALHTPGPWTLHGCAIYQADCWNGGNNEGGRYIGSTYYGSPEEESDDSPTEEQYANGRLIAAAPELLQACRMAADNIRQGYPLDVCAVLEHLESAIAKAEGQ